ncbi:TPA_asm: hypothetical protein vir526_00005 [Caudoviricetes sp. vir526]|nr:TPA_asm: hypothetical protein vir526_00005 [Caudoviricetes sp. vir526]
MKKSFEVGEIVKLVDSDGYIIDPEIPMLKGCKLKDIWGIIVDTYWLDNSNQIASVWLFSNKDGQLLSLSNKLRPWKFSFSALEHVEQKEREKYNFS